MQMEQNMLDIGKMICSMVMVKKLGLMDHSLKENILTVKSTAIVHFKFKNKIVACIL